MMMMMVMLNALNSQGVGDESGPKGEIQHEVELL